MILPTVETATSRLGIGNLTTIETPATNDRRTCHSDRMESRSSEESALLSVEKRLNAIVSLSDFDPGQKGISAHIRSGVATEKDPESSRFLKT